MVTVIRCSGHSFDGVKPKNPFGITNEWKCKECGLVVHTLDAANFLQGRIS